MFKLIALVVFLSAALRTVLSKKECNEPLLTDCLASGMLSMMVHFPLIVGVDKDKGCVVANEGREKCVDLTESCKDKYPQKAKFISSYIDVILRICADSGKGYEDLTECIQKHPDIAEKCTSNSPAPSKNEDPAKVICRGIDITQCRSNSIKKVCGKGEPYFTNLEKSITEFQFYVCSSSSGIFAYNFWIFTLTFCVLLSVRNKF